MKYVGRSNSAPEHKAIKERAGKMQSARNINVHFLIKHRYTAKNTYTLSQSWT